MSIQDRPPTGPIKTARGTVPVTGDAHRLPFWAVFRPRAPALPDRKGPIMPDDLADSVELSLANQRQGERRAGERRAGRDRRQAHDPDYSGPERRHAAPDRRTSPDRRLGGLSGRRAEDRKLFEERIENGELTLEEVEFIRAIDRYKRKFNRPFPTWSEILLIVKHLGYTKDAL